MKGFILKGFNIKGIFEGINLKGLNFKEFIEWDSILNECFKGFTF